MPKPGEHIFKGHRSYDLMRELQLGIMFSIANASKNRMSLSASDVTQEAFGLEVFLLHLFLSSAEPFLHLSSSVKPDSFVEWCSARDGVLGVLVAHSDVCREHSMDASTCLFMPSCCLH